jgi:hypothetical protein
MSGVVQKQVLFNRILQGVENRLRGLLVLKVFGDKKADFGKIKENKGK